MKDTAIVVPARAEGKEIVAGPFHLVNKQLDLNFAEIGVESEGHAKKFSTE